MAQCQAVPNFLSKVVLMSCAAAWATKHHQCRGTYYGHYRIHYLVVLGRGVFVDRHGDDLHRLRGHLGRHVHTLSFRTHIHAKVKKKLSKIKSMDTLLMRYALTFVRGLTLIVNLVDLVCQLVRRSVRIVSKRSSSIKRKKEHGR